jgi:thiol-disulfide isomerase/thioredoxin
MDLPVALAVTAAVLGVAAIAGILLTRARGRARTPADEVRIDAGTLPGLDELAAGATVVQFSTEFCASCPGTRRLLGQIVGERDDLTLVEVDLTHRADLARDFSILQTPTVFVIDADGILRTRFGGAPRRDDVVAAIDSVITERQAA